MMIWNSPVTQQGKDPALSPKQLESLLWFRFNPWPRNICMSWVQQKKNKKRQRNSFHKNLTSDKWSRWFKSAARAKPEDKPKDAKYQCYRPTLWCWEYRWHQLARRALFLFRKPDRQRCRTMSAQNSNKALSSGMASQKWSREKIAGTRGSSKHSMNDTVRCHIIKETIMHVWVGNLLGQWWSWKSI